MKEFFANLFRNVLEKCRNLSLFQIFGTALLLTTLILTYLKITWVALGILLFVVIIDVILVLKSEKTISQWIHKLFPKAVDMIIMIGLLVFTWFVFGAEGFLPVCIGAIMGHLFWQ